MATKFSRFPVTRWGLLAAATVVASSTTVVGFLGRLWWPFELGSHFRAQYFLFLMGTAFLFLLGRKRRAAILASVFALVNLSLIVPFYMGSASTHAEGRTVRAVLVNVNTANQAYGRLQKFIRSVEPDFMVLLEVNRIWLNELQKLQAEYPFSRARPRDDNFGIALFSRIPFGSAGIRRIGRAGVPSVVAQFDIDGQSVTVIGTHPLPPVGRAYAAHRNQQLAELAHLVGSQKGAVMVLGDLNTTSWSPFFGDLIRKTGLRDSRNGFGVQPTWPAGLPHFWVPIDHCLVSSGVVVHNRRTGPDIGSDHYPVVVDFSVEPHSPPDPPAK
ncbi:MAG: endonuclease/exonuclease/phosphatase family protein [Candidatus Methylomirabilales bacterium]